jgi:4-hydroxybenzoate polyprenyltransferase
MTDKQPEPASQIPNKASAKSSRTGNRKSAAKSTKTKSTQEHKPQAIAPSTPATTTNAAPATATKPAAKKYKTVAKSKKTGGKLHNYALLMRLNKPIGTLLLLWPTLWSLWFAAKGMPSLKNLVIFTLGVFLMRAAGCVINDFADRKIDGKVKRTQDRPLATGAVSSLEALALFILLCLAAFGLVLLTNTLTIQLSVGGLLLAICYPFMKRYTHLPQVVLGAAFAWSIPMAYAAETGEIPSSIWLVYLAVVLWTLVYDTFYAMVDRDDDLKIGVKSTAILFGEQDRFITGTLQAITLYTLYLVGNRFELGSYYQLSLIFVAVLFVYQQWLIRHRMRDACFKAFLNNNWVGLAIFVGIAVDLALKS